MVAVFTAGALASLVAACASDRLVTHPAVSTSPVAVAPQGDEAEAPGRGEPEQRHVIRPGETLWSISRDTGVGVHTLMRANGIRADEVTRLQVGRRISIPAGSQGHASAAVAATPAPRSQPTRTAARRASTSDRAMLVVDAHLGQARDRFEAADFEGALADAQRAAQLLAGMGSSEPVRDRRVQALLLEGMAEAALGQPDQARASFREARVLDPGVSLDPTTTSPKLITLFEQAAAQP